MHCPYLRVGAAYCDHITKVNCKVYFNLIKNYHPALITQVGFHNTASNEASLLSFNRKVSVTLFECLNVPSNCRIIFSYSLFQRNGRKKFARNYHEQLSLKYNLNIFFALSMLSPKILQLFYFFY